MNLCTCQCHVEGTITRHFSKCCDATYQKYIETDGRLNYKKFEAATKTCEQCQHWQPHLDDASAAEAEKANLERFAENCSNWLCNDENGKCPIVKQEHDIVRREQSI